MRIFIEPTDVWLFRDGRPFSAGADHRARTLFPPSPHTVAGALRAIRFAESGLVREDYVKGESAVAQALWREIGKPPDRQGRNGSYGTFELRALHVAREEAQADGTKKVVRYFPTPADVVRVGGALRVTAPLPLKTKNPDQYYFLSDLPTHFTWVKDVRAVGSPGGWLSEENLRHYLRGESFTVVGDGELFERESRFNVGIDSERKRPREGDRGGHLFQVEWVRLRHHVGLDAEVLGITLPDDGLLALGGELRSGRYRKVNETVENFNAPFERRFKLYLATPAWFDVDGLQGWQPEDWSPYFRGAKVKLVSAVIPRAQPIGGWDVANELQKPLRHFVPAGSVFYFELTDGARQQIKDRTFITDGGLAVLGFGITYTGGWDYV